MAVQIGSKYLANLYRLRLYAEQAKTESPQRHSKFIIFDVEERGTCYYDRCPYKKLKSDTVIAIAHPNKREEAYFFHDDCLLEMINDDERLNDNTDFINHASLVTQ